MARHKDAFWGLPDKSDGYPMASLAVLMDIRDELKRMNTLLHCENFQGIPRKLDRISRNTAKPRKRKS